MKKNEKTVTFLSLGNRPNPELLKAAQSLGDARNYLLYAKGDFGGRPEGAIQRINGPVDEIRAYEEKGNLYR